MITGIEHTAIASPDPEKLGKWYVETLGFTIRYFSEKSKTTFVETPDGAMLEIIKANDKPRPAGDQRDPGLRHLALSVNDFAADYAALKAKGVNFISEPQTGANSLVFFTDPDGNILHLLHREKPL